MALTRRQFLTLMGGTTGAAVLFQACGVPEMELLVDAPVEMPEDLVTGTDNWYATVCRQCDNAEGLVVRVMEGRAKKIEGNIDYPINRGGHSPRCEAGLQALYHPDRISAPLVRTGSRGSGEYREISWDDAIKRLAESLNSVDSIANDAVLVTDPIGGHLGFVVDAFVSKTEIKRHVYEPLETNVVRRAVEEIFGQSAMPDFDIENAEYLLSFGADFLSTWNASTRYARGYGEFRQGRQGIRGKLVHVDSRFSATAANADKWIKVNPGTEGLFALGLIQTIVSKGDVNSDVIAALFPTGGRRWINDYDPSKTIEKMGIKSIDIIEEVAAEFVQSHHAIAIGGGSAAAHSNGFESMKAVYSLNHIVENIGKKGGVLLNPESPLAEIKSSQSGDPFTDFQKLSSDMDSGLVKLLMVRGANPYYGLPDVTGFKDRISKVDTVVSFSGMMDDTTAMADLILPEHNYLEDWGTDIPLSGTGYQTVGFQQPVVRPFFENRGDNLGTKGFADVLMTLAQVMDVDLQLKGDTFKDIIRDGARQLFDMNRGSVKGANSFEDFWNGVLQRGGWWDINSKGPSYVKPSALEKIPDPIIIGNGDFYLQPFPSASLYDGRGAALPWLQAMPDPISTATWQTWVEINHEEADKLGIKEGDVLEITSGTGRKIKALAMPNPATPNDVIGIPFGQGHRDYGRYATGRGANVMEILADVSDARTGSLAWAANKITITPTGDWIRVPKFENTVPDFPRDEHQDIIQVFSKDEMENEH
jgi:anaerobic selenocysteine-containing dehydrogenase